MRRKVYEIELNTIGPVHIGTGEKLRNSQYLYDFRDKKVYIPDEKKFFNWIIDKGLIDSYERFLLGRGSNNLFNWIRNNNLREDFLKTVDYTLDTSSIYTSRDVWFNDLDKMTKDKDNNPYIPGSSLKGLIRNALINYEFSKIRAKDTSDSDFVKKYYNDRKRGIQKNRALGGLRSSGDRLVNSILKDKSIKDNNNLSIMRNILISDSETISKSNLILCQKIDTSVNKKENKLPIFRESIKPNTRIIFQMIIKNNPYIDIDTILEAIEVLYMEIDGAFLKHFGVEEREGLLCYIGGGSGFLSKTAIYSLMDENEGKKIVNQIMQDKFPKGGHAQKDIKVSPKTLKNTKYKNRNLEMGLCSVSFREVDGI